MKIKATEIEASALRDEAARLRVLCDKQANDLHRTEEQLELARDQIVVLQQEHEEQAQTLRRHEQEKKSAEELMLELSRELQRAREESGARAMPTTSPESIRLEELHQELEEMRQKNRCECNNYVKRNEICYWRKTWLHSPRGAERGTAGHNADQPGHHADKWSGTGSPFAQWNPEQSGPGTGGDVTSSGGWSDPFPYCPLLPLFSVVETVIPHPQKILKKVPKHTAYKPKSTHTVTSNRKRDEISIRKPILWKLLSALRPSQGTYIYLICPHVYLNWHLLYYRILWIQPH